MSARYIVGDVFDGIAALEDGSVDLLLTSPPFLALRSYLPADHPDKAREIGSEPTPEAFIDTLLDLVEAVTPKLSKYGTIAIELGDTYSGSGGAGGDYGEGGLRDGQEAFDGSSRRMRTVGSREHRDERGGTTADGGERVVPQNGGAGWPLAKSLCLIPESFRWALVYGKNPFNGRTTERWRARNVVRWCRPNPPVGALGDKFRPATSEMVIACKARDRWFDLDSVRTPLTEPEREFAATHTDRNPTHGWGDDDAPFTQNAAGAPPLDWWEIPTEAETLPGFDPAPERTTSRVVRGDVGAKRRATMDGGELHAYTQDMAEAGAPPLDWWSIPTQPYAGSHYATWPERLCVRPIEAMCPRQVCRVCGEPRRRITGKAEYVPSANPSTGSTSLLTRPGAMAWERDGRTIADGVGAHTGKRDGGMVRDAPTLGWSDCGHGDQWRRGLVLDPFAGSGTTLAVALGHGRDAIGIDLDQRNADLAYERIGGLFLTVEHLNATEEAS